MIMKYKLIVVVDNQLKMPKGKLAREVAGAVTHVLMYSWSYFKFIKLLPWYKGGMKTIVLKTDDMDTLVTTMQTLRIKYFPMIDDGKTVFNGVPTRTCIGFPICTNEKTPVMLDELKLL